MSYREKSVFGLIFFFIAVFAISQDNLVLKVEPEDKNLSKQIKDFLALGDAGIKVIEFASGEYHLDSPLFLNSNTILKGDSAYNTELIFDLEGKGSCINIVGRREKLVKEVVLNYQPALDRPKGELNEWFKIYNGHPDEVGLSKWGSESFGQIISGVQGGDKLLIIKNFRKVEKKLLGDTVLCYKIHPVRNVSIQNLNIVRLDQSESQTSNIQVEYAIDCQLDNVRSKHCNYSHVTMENSYGILINHCKFIGAFNHGNGGKAYGVAIQYGSTNCEVTGCHFDSLRHGVVLQLGANNNFILENYFSNGFWTDVFLPKKAAGDIVLHGNYPYMNFIKGNICNNIVIDNSHGANGPSNLFEHNKTLLFGIYMNKKSVEGMTYILENEILKRGCLKGRLRYKNNEVESCGNTINGKIKKDRGGCESVSTNEILKSNIARNVNDATFYFGITVSEK